MVKPKVEFNINLFTLKAFDLNIILKRSLKINSLYNVNCVKSEKNHHLLSWILSLDEIVSAHKRKPNQSQG